MEDVHVEVKDFLQQCRLGHHLGVLLPHLVGLGVTCLEDLLDVEREDMKGVGLTVIETNRFFRMVNEQLKSPVVSSSSASGSLVGSSVSTTLVQSIPSSSAEENAFSSASFSQVRCVVPPAVSPSMSLPLQNPTAPVILPPLQMVHVSDSFAPHALVSPTALLSSQNASMTTSPEATITTTPVATSAEKPSLNQVRYLLCTNLFSADIKEKYVISIDPRTTAMKDLYGLIKHAVSVGEGFTLELFSHEGYPLCANEFTSSCTLFQWRVYNNDLFYVFVRREDQPDAAAPQALQPLDHTVGDDELVVESTVFGTFSIKACVDSDSPDVIQQKVANVSKVPTPNICLYTRRGYESLNVDTELRDGDVMTLVLKNPQDYYGSLGTEYGAKTYNPVVPQTDAGISKFFSILKFICSKQRDNVDFPRLLAYLRKLTNCPPMVHALKLLYENSYLNLPCWVALVEGFYQLCRTFLSSFCIVEDKRVFEFSDYFWGLLIDKSELFHQRGGEEEDFEKLCLVCPISHLKITNPVTIPGCTEVFDGGSVFERIESGVSIAGCSVAPLTEDHITPDEFTSRLLMYNPWHNEKEVYVWKQASKMSPIGQQWMRMVPMPCDWVELASKLPSLRIAAPDGLFSGNECLTFIDNGQLVYFMGFSKGKDSERKVFNPVKCEYEYHGITAMARVAKTKDALAGVSHDLTKFLKPEIKSRTSRHVLEKARPEPVVAQKQVETVNWDPEEAVVVLLDVSGSMSLNIFDEEDEVFTRLQAAKDFFEAFANRSQAYDFHHSLGLTIFNTTVTVTQRLTRIYQFFRESLDKVEANYQTALNDAMMSAVKQLKEYTKEFPLCRRRILCLTDGCDNNSKKKPHEVAKALQQENVVVDTVLIIDSPDNVTQKAITHATGGACFLPKSQSEAVKLFEMETLLSIRARVMPENIPGVRSARDLKLFESLSVYPYNTGQLPNNFIHGVQLTKTASADKVLRMASLAIRLEESQAAAPSGSVRRILREINEFRRNPHTDIEIFPSEESMTVWKILLLGPEATPYAGGVFLLCAKFPSTYPGKPPEVRFLTPIYHCNINSSGRICHRVFGPSYTPSVTMRDILSCVCGLLMSPEPDDPLDSVLADEYHSNRPVYMEKARKWTQEHATKKSFAEMKKELSGGDEAAGPTDLKCPLTGKLFEDPVIAPSGHTYERAAIMEYIQKHGGKDPVSKQPLSASQLTPNRAMKALVEQYKKGSSKIVL